MLRGDELRTAADGTTPRVRVTLLNGFALELGGTRVPLPVPAQRLVAFLALNAVPLARTYVAGTLWPDASEQRASGSLRSAVWRLGGDRGGIVKTTPRQIQLGADVSVDTRHVRASIDRLAACIGDPPADDLAAVALPGAVLPDWYDDWVTLEREELSQARVHILESAAERLAASGRFAAAIHTALAAVALEPLRESAHRTVVRIHLVEGNAAAALRQYRLYRERLVDSLELEPSAQMDELIRPLLAPSPAGRPG